MMTAVSGRTLGRVIKSMRRASDLTRGDLRRRLAEQGIETSIRQLQRIEADEADPRLSLLRAIARALKASVRELLKETS